MNLYLGAWHSCTVGLVKTLKQLEELNLQVWQFCGLRSQNVGGSPDLSMPWMVNGCGLITDNDFQISIKTFFTIFYIPYILWLYKTGFVMGQGESTHGEQPSSGPVWRHGRAGEEKPLQPRHINPYIRIQSLARPPDPSTQPPVRRLEYQIWTKYFLIFLLWMESQAELSAHSDPFHLMPGMQQPRAQAGIRSNGCGG